MPTVSFQNNDYDTEAEAIKRQQAMADLIRQQSLQIPELPTAMGGHQVQARLSPAVMIAKMLQGVLAGKEGRAVEDRQRMMTERYNNELKAGMERFAETSQGQPAISLPPDQAGPVQAALPGDVRKAIMEALASNHPALKQFAMQQLAEQAKGQLTPKDLMGISTPESVLANPNNPRAWAPQRKLTPVASGEVMLDAGGNIAQPGGGQGQFPAVGPDGNVQGNGWKTIELNGDKYMLTPTGLKKLDNATKVTTTVDLQGNKAASKFAEKISEHRAEQLAKSYEVTKDLPQTMATLDEASSALAEGIKSGMTGNIALVLAKTGKALGLSDASPEIANSEVFRSSMARSVLNVLKTLRPASDKDVEYAEKAAGGNLTLDDAAMLRLVDSAKVAVANQLYSHNKLLEDNKKGSGAIAEDLDTFNVPFSVSGDHMEFRNGRFVSTSSAQAAKASPARGSKKVLTLDEYLKGGR